MTRDQHYTPRFQPHDQEIVTYFLNKKISGDRLPVNEIIEELKFYDYSPMQLAGMHGLADQKDLYFFTHRNCVPKRKAGDGYWKSIRSYEGIKQRNEIIGYKKLLRFCQRSSRKSSTTTDWYMIEYKSGVMAPKATGALYAWVLCRVYEKMTNAKNVLYSQNQGNGALHVTGDLQLYKSQKMTSDLPIEVVTEILSWLPVKSLMRFKCVCKQWCFFIDQDSKFKAKHYDRASPLELSYLYEWETNTKAVNMVFNANFIYYSNFGGLFLERIRTRSQVFRVRNPAMHQALYLPDTHDGTSGIDFALNLFTGECKVACFYVKNVTYFGTEVGFEVITIGKDDRWRPLKLPKQNGKLEPGKRDKNVLQRRTFGPDKVEGGAHLVESIWDGHQSYLEVQSFDVWSECFTVTTLPQGVFSDLTKVFSLRWNHFLAVADITDEALNVLVLENFKEHKWNKKKIIIPLKFLKEKPHLKGRIRPREGGHYFEGRLHNGVEYITFYEPENGYFFYDINTEETDELAKEQYEGKSNTNYKKTSLITLKGMAREYV